MSNEAKFRLMCKCNSEFNFMFLAYDGFLLIKNLEKDVSLNINFSNYELFNDHFVQMLDYFLGNKSFGENQTEIIILENSSSIYFWKPLVQNEKMIQIHKSFKSNCHLNFTIELNVDDFFSFLKCFSCSIIPTLLLQPDEKLIFNTFFYSSFEWNKFQILTFDETYLIDYIIHYKNHLELQIDVSNIVSLFKVYFPILEIIKKANGFILFHLDENTDSNDVQNEQNDSSHFNVPIQYDMQNENYVINPTPVEK